MKQKTTVVLEEHDKEDLREIARLQRVSETEALRRCVRMTRQLMAWKEEGGEIVLKRGRHARSIEFL